MYEYPELGHMVYDEYGHLGLVIETDDYEGDVINIIIEWYIDGDSYREPYRVGRIKHSDDLMFMRLSYYTEMRERYRKQKAEICK